MVRKSLRRGLALGTSRAVRGEAAIGAACLEPAHDANAWSGKQLFWHFPLLQWHTVLLVPVLGGGCRDTNFLLALTPARCLSGWSEKLGWVSSGRALSFVLPGCWTLLLPSLFATPALWLWALPSCRAFSPAQGGHPENPWSWAGMLLFSVKFYRWGSLERGKDSEPSGRQSTQTPWEWLQGCPLPSHTGTALQTEVPSPGLSVAAGAADPMVTSH